MPSSRLGAFVNATGQEKAGSVPRAAESARPTESTVRCALVPRLLGPKRERGARRRPVRTAAEPEPSYLTSIVTFSIATGSEVFPEFEPTASILFSVPVPSVTSP